MGIKIKDFDKVVRYVEKQSETLRSVFLDDLNYIGLTAVKYVRNRSKEESWEDQTGNLRSSIGYVIVRNGVIVGRSGFEKVDGPKRSKTTDDGSMIGESYAEALAKQYTKGYALIIVAGMNYASYLEDIHSRDVLKGGELEARRLVDKLVADYRKMRSK